jgi:F-type H+-transporting ATPase subunit delta
MKISKEAKRSSRQLFKACLKDGQLDENLVRTVVAKVSAARPRGYIAILEAFGNLVAAELDRSKATVESAMDLDSGTMYTLQRSLAQKYGRPLSLEFRIVPELLGGIRVKVGSDVWDGSVKARLTALQNALV